MGSRSARESTDAPMAWALILSLFFLLAPSMFLGSGSTPVGPKDGGYLTVQNDPHATPATVALLPNPEPGNLLGAPHVGVAGTKGLTPHLHTANAEARPPLTITSFTSTHTTMDLGMSTTFTTVVTGGKTPYTYEYDSLPVGCASANVSALFCQPSALGTTTTEVTVTDAVRANVTANLTSSVSPALAITSFTSSRTVVTVSIAFNLTVVVSGGSVPITYAYYALPSNCLGADSSTLSCTPGAQGNYSIRVNVTDAASAIASSTTPVRVNPFPSVTIRATPPSKVNLGASLELNTTVTGGTPPLTYSYTGLPPGCNSANAAIISCQPNATGVYTISVTVTDVFGASQAVSVVVSVREPTPASAGSVAGTPWWEWAGAILAVALVAGVALFLFLQLRHRPPPTQEDSIDRTTSPRPDWSEDEADERAKR